VIAFLLEATKFVGEAIIIGSSFIALSVLIGEDVQEYFVFISHWPSRLLWGTPLPRPMFIDVKFFQSRAMPQFRWPMDMSYQDS
jgi:hypothetical protein